MTAKTMSPMMRVLLMAKVHCAEMAGVRRSEPTEVPLQHHGSRYIDLIYVSRPGPSQRDVRAKATSAYPKSG